MTAIPEKVIDLPGKPADQAHLADRIFFGFGTLSAVWLAWALVRVSLGTEWWRVLPLILFWLVLSYLTLPRLNRALSAIYVPGYFIGRTRTSDGLLGDPLNLAFRGTGEQVSTALSRAGWIKADPVNLASSVRIVTSTLTGRSYREAPVSPLLLFGRQQDAAYQQEVSGNPAQRHHVRLWRTPEGWLLPGGHRVDWLAGGTYDRRVGLSLFTLQITHKIDGNIDVERDFIVDSLTESEPAATVEPLVNFTAGYHSRNGGGDSIHTDGTLPVVDLSAVAPEPELDPLVNPAAANARWPYQVVLPAVLTLVAGPLALLTSFGNGGVALSATEGWVLGVAWLLAVVSIVCAIRMLGRSARARRCLLLLASLIVLVQLGHFELSGALEPRLTAIYHAGVMILVVLALSSPTATSWCRRG